MADVTYNTSSFPMLVNTLKSIVAANSETRPYFLLGYKQRDESERSLWDMMKVIGLDFTQVGEVPGYGGAPIEIWIA
jgi:protein N-lysine methyltransferase METTL21D